MKITFAKSLVTHLANSLSKVNLAAATALNNNEAYNKSLKKRFEVLRGFVPDFETYQSEIKEKNVNQSVGLIIPFYMIETLESFTKKYLSVTVTEEDVEVDFNDEFIKDTIDMLEKLYLKVIPGAANIIGELCDGSFVEEYEDKWQIGGHDIKVESKLTEVKTHGWTFTADLYHEPRAIKVENKMINCLTYVATKGDLSIKVYPHTIINVIDNKTSILESKYSSDFIEALQSLTSSIISK